MSEFAEEICSDAQERMERAVLHAQNEYSTVRTGRATPALVEKLKVDYLLTPKVKEIYRNKKNSKT